MRIMEQNPLHSKDVNYGIPQIFNDMLCEYFDDQEEEEEEMEEFQKVEVSELQQPTTVDTGNND